MANRTSLQANGVASVRSTPLPRPFPSERCYPRAKLRRSLAEVLPRLVDGWLNSRIDKLIPSCWAADDPA